MPHYKSAGKLLLRSKAIHEEWYKNLRSIRYGYYGTILQRLRFKDFHPDPWVCMRPWKIEPSKVKVVFVVSGSHYHDRKLVDGHALSAKIAGSPSRWPLRLTSFLRTIGSELGFTMPRYGSLQPLVDKGMMFIHLSLTTDEESPYGHYDVGWEYIVYDTIRYLNHKYEGIVFVFMGEIGWYLSINVDEKKHLVLRTGHPGNWNAGDHLPFGGVKLFITICKYLRVGPAFFKLPAANYKRRKIQ